MKFFATHHSTIPAKFYQTNSITTFSKANGVVNYLYDDNGNRLSKITQLTTDDGSSELKRKTTNQRLRKEKETGKSTLVSTVYSYDTASNRLINTVMDKTSLNLSYDAAGNTLKDGQYSYTYNARGRLVQVAAVKNEKQHDAKKSTKEPEKSVTLAQYSLNGLGQRLRKLTSSGEVRFVYDEAGHLLGEYSSAGKPIQETVYLGDMPVAVLTKDAVSYIYTDHLNAPRVITNSAGKAVWQWESDPFGVTPAAAVSNKDEGKKSEKEKSDENGQFVYNLRFPGQYFDSETGLHYNYFRDYNPSSGRYIESDPIGLNGGLNTYSYVRGNPLSFVDLFGLKGGCPANMKPGDGNSCVPDSGTNDKNECGTPECAAEIPGPPTPKTKCKQECNVKYQYICTGLGIGTTIFINPTTGMIAGLSCIVVKYFVCDKSCEPEKCNN